MKTWNKAVVTKAVRDMVKRHVFHERPRTPECGSVVNDRGVLCRGKEWQFQKLIFHL